PVALSAANFSANANAAGQNVYITDSNAGTTTINSSSGANSVFHVVAAGSLNSSAATAITGSNISLTATSGYLGLSGTVG
ncbi:hypothetical protein ABTD92_22005, partial [Acinetobacter baumannii]